VGGSVLKAWPAALALAVVAAGCAAGDDSELAPLPIEGGTGAGTTTTSSTVPDATGRTTPGGLPVPAGGPSTSTSSTVVATPTGDWDGATFDVGLIESVSALGAYSTIELDRWSYTDPAGRTADAGGLTEEPVVAWWRTSPFSNVRVQTRTFVLDPDVEVLTLDPAGRGAACAVPPPASPPAPVWLRSGTSALGSMAPGDVAVLTYSDAGLVTRLRLTRGC
jgi:hypothetical protein